MASSCKYVDPSQYGVLNEYLEKKAEEEACKLNANFEKLLNFSRETNETYKSLFENTENTRDLYIYYLQENNTLEKKLKDLTGSTLTNDRKTFYQNQGINTLDDWYNMMKWIYYFIVVVIGFYLFLTRNNYSFLTKIIILLILFFYPYLVKKIFPSTSTMYEKRETDDIDS